MAAPRLDALIGQIERLSGGSCESPGTDRQLLDDFAARHDQAAFAGLVARHGPLVLRVCRRVLHHEQDAEDAFQATFLVLAQNLGSIRKREALADWLHGVAYRTAMKTKRTAARRRNHETQMRERTPSAATSPTWDDVQAVLDEEIQRLPPVFRSAFVLCVLEGKTIAAVAAELSCKDGTVATRVMRARQRLQQQLARRGIELGALLAAVCVAETGLKAAIPAALCHSAVRNGLLVAAGETAAGAIPSHVAALATGVSRAMFMQKAKLVVYVVLTLGLFSAGAGVLSQQLLKADEKAAATQPPVKPLAEPVKPAADSIEVTGRVLDPDGKPVAKARLYQPRRRKEIQYATMADCDAVSVGVTDAEGRFRVQLLRSSPLSRWPFQLLAVADGFGLNWVNLPKEEKPEEVTLRLVKDQVVRGRLVNTEGKPVVGVTIDVNGLWSSLDDLLNHFQDERAYGKVAHGVDVFTPLNKVAHVPATDKDGRFEIIGLGTERGILGELKSPTAVISPFIVATREGFDAKPWNSRKGSKKLLWLMYGPSFEWAVLPTRSLEGTVREVGSNKPVVGAKVNASVGWISIDGVTDTHGRYQLNGLVKADKYHVYVEPGTIVPLLGRSVEVAGDRLGLETLTCNIELSRGVLVKGRVLDKASGNGVRSRVTSVALPDNPFAAKLSDPKFNSRTVETDTEGRFSLVTVPGSGVLLAQVWYDVNRVDGTAVNPYKLAEFDEADRKRVKVIDGRLMCSEVIQARSEGTRDFLIYHNAYKVVDLKEDAGPFAFDLTVDPGKTRTLSLQGPDGKQLTGVVASGLSAMSYSVAPLKTTTCPLFALDPDQARQLAFLHTERQLAAHVTVRGDDKEPMTIRLVPAAAITGRFLDSEGQPLSGAEVYLSYSGDERAVNDIADHLNDQRLSHGRPPLRTDKDGRVRLEGVFPDVKFSLFVSKGRVGFFEETKTERGPLKSGVTLDIGDIRVKPRSP